MDETVPPATDPRPSIYPGSSANDAQRRSIESLGASAVEACGGLAAVIRWPGAHPAGVTYLPADGRWRAALAAILALAERLFEHLPSTIETVPLEAGQLAPLIGERLRHSANVQGIARRRAHGNYNSVTILLAPVGRPARELAALAHLVSELLERIITADEVQASRDFWLATGSASGSELSALRAELAAAMADQADFDASLQRLAKLRPRQRFAGLGAMFAQAGALPEWIVARFAGDDGLQIEAASRTLAPLPPLIAGGPLAGCVARNEVAILPAASLTRSDSAPGVASLPPLAGFDNYLCVPCGPVAIVLAVQLEVTPKVLGKLTRLAQWLSPLTEKWLREEEIERLQKLVGSLGLRMFSAVDWERQRIARDLHDHQSQLLAAARIALETDPARTRAILRELDSSLRQQLREIRPVTLGRTPLRRALGLELERLADAGIRGKLIYPARATKLARPLEELCYQVAREAVSNIIRHSRASRAELSVTRLNSQIVVRVADNGPGLRLHDDRSPAAKKPGGVGLEGMAERLALMGGRLRIERVGKTTQLTAEIPLL